VTIWWNEAGWKEVTIERGDRKPSGVHGDRNGLLVA